MNTPFFPIWRQKLAALGRHRSALGQQTPVDIERQCARFLSRGLLASPPRGPGSRRRVFDRSRTFWLFIWQALQPDTACRAVVRQVQAFCETPQRRIDESSSAYCQARARLPLPCMRHALRDSARAADQIGSQQERTWQRTIKVVDATSVQLPDTDKNRSLYPYPSGQKPGCGFPVMGVLDVHSLTSGAILETVQSPWSTHDFRLFHQIWPTLESGDIVLGDRAFGAYAALAFLPLRGVDMVSRLHQSRKVNLRGARRIGKDEWLVRWTRPTRCSNQVLSSTEWEALPAEITVRILHIRIAIRGFRTRSLWISTTLLDPIAYPAGEIAALYLRRWELEICFRDLKTTMGMERLRCLTPDMVTRELLAYLIAHNFMRCLIAQAAAAHGIPRTRISFKGAIDAARSFYLAMRCTRSATKCRRLYARLLEIIALDALPYRPYRSEPRAVKRRPKNYQRLTRPRHLFRECPHRNLYKAPSTGLS